ncbi:MAG: hypothetical protein DHS20C15_25550 [Planctomycetota bacterium]|nr:MAG: hypothetical protein DHS20C15_25550 [Planctomycetota bacterium]
MLRITTRCLLVALASVGALSFSACGNKSPETLQLERMQVARAAGVPSDVKLTCVVSPTDFASWFQSGSVSEGGFVTAADSLVAPQSACDAYTWSWRMFLWQFSENSGELVFNSPPFFDLNEQNELVSDAVGTGGQKTKHVRGGKRESVDRDGQAGAVNGVLMSQDVSLTPGGSLVYYAIHVNDVYAYMASGVNSGDLAGQQGMDEFPTTSQQLATIVDYATQSYGVTINDANSLAMEVKSSWVKVTPGMDASTYATIVADVPKYTRDSENKKWTWDGVTQEEDVTLACVGFHIVGSMADHPEMIWATFEHVNNVPLGDYYYLNESGTVTEQKNWNNGAPVPGVWLFMDGTSREASMNQMHMELNGNDIVALSGETISPSNTMRSQAWGDPDGEASAANNTDILSINQNIVSMLSPGDVRANYALVGATYTKNGVPGVGIKKPVFEGSTLLANSTMETYYQSKSCFGCHNGGMLSGLSHIFTGVKPLPKPSK